MIEALLLLTELALFYLLLLAVSKPKNADSQRTLGLFKYKTLKTDQVIRKQKNKGK